MKLQISPPMQTAFLIITGDEDLCRRLQLKHGKYLHRHQTGGPAEVIEYSDNRLTFHGETIETPDPLHEIDRIMFEHTRYDDSVYALHGAAVEYGGAAYLFLASTTSGKTTLASYLANKGFGYITDDCILLNRGDYKIHPYNTPIHLREGGLEVLKNLGISPDTVCLEAKYASRYIYTPENCVTEPLPLGRIFFIERTEDENLVVPMRATESMTGLLHAPITDYAVTGDYLRFLSRLVKSQNICRLKYSDMEYVSEVLRNG